MLARAAETATSDRARYYVLVAFVGLVFLAGGASRPDVLSLPILRPLSILVLGYALWTRVRTGATQADGLLLFLSCFVVLHIAQLIPLPQFLWSQLPQRHVFALVGGEAGLGNVARPLTLSPATTVNSLFALAAPLAVSILLGTLDAVRRRRILRGLLIPAAASCALGMLQISSGGGSGFYLYRVTNSEAPVGLFANRNHQALFLACSIALAIWSVRLRLPLQRQTTAVAGCAFDVALIAVAIVLLMEAGSRSGLVFGACALTCGAAMILWSLSVKSARKRSHRDDRRRDMVRFWLACAVTGMLLVGLVAFTIAMSRDASLQRFFSLTAGDEIRGNTLPILLQMARDYFPYGSGFGTFAAAYKAVEPATLLSPLYLNQAHDDFVQLGIEGGIAAMILLGLFLVWFFRLAVRANLRAWRERSLAAPIITMSTLFFAASSSVDYPLRVPSLMVVFVILIRSLEDRAVGRPTVDDAPSLQSRFTSGARLSIVNPSGQLSSDQ